MARVFCSAVAVGLLTAVLFFLYIGPVRAAESSPFLGLPDGTFSWKGYFEALAILCFLFFSFFAVLWLVKRFFRGGMRFGVGDPELRIENRLALGPRKWIMAVRYMDKRLLIGVTDQNVTLLTETPVDPEPEVGGNSFPDRRTGPEP